MLELGEDLFDRVDGRPTDPFASLRKSTTVPGQNCSGVQSLRAWWRPTCRQWPTLDTQFVRSADFSSASPRAASKECIVRVFALGPYLSNAGNARLGSSQASLYIVSNGAQTDPRIGAQKGPLFGDKRRRQRAPRRSWSGLRSRGARGLASSRLLEGQARFLKRQLSLPVSTMSQ